MATTLPQTLVSESSDAGLTAIYPGTLQEIPLTTGNTSIYVTNQIENVTNIIKAAFASGDNQTVQFNTGSQFTGDSGFIYNMYTDTLTVSGSVITGNVRTDSILHANGDAWEFSSLYSNSNVSSYLTVNSGLFYANSNVASYLPGYVGNINANNITATNITGRHIGNGSYLTSLTGSAVTGYVPNSANANIAGTVRPGHHPNITGVGTLDALTVVDTINGNITGFAGSSIIAATVTASSQPNITSVGTLDGLSVSSTIVGSISGAAVSATVAGTVSTAYQPNITGVGTLSNLTVGTTGVLQVQNTLPSTNTTTGALRVVGGIASQGNVHANHIHAFDSLNAGKHLFAGQNSQGSSFQNQIFIGKDTDAAYVQSAMVNSADTGSADWVVYGDSGSDEQGWVDMGYTGTAYDDPNFTITHESDGYLFAHGMTGQGGNLILATGDYGSSTARDIIFATGGFLAEDEKLRLSHYGNTLKPYSNTVINLGDVAHYYNNAYIKNVITAGIVKTGVFVTGTIPSASSVGAGARTFVTDATSNTFGAVYTGGGSNSMPVFSNGSSWYIG